MLHQLFWSYKGPSKKSRCGKKRSFWWMYSEICKKMTIKYLIHIIHHFSIFIFLLSYKISILQPLLMVFFFYNEMQEICKIDCFFFIILLQKKVYNMLHIGTFWNLLFFNLKKKKSFQVLHVPFHLNFENKITL